MENRMALAYAWDRGAQKICGVTADYHQATRDGYEWIKRRTGPNGIQIVGEDASRPGQPRLFVHRGQDRQVDADGVPC